MKILLVSTDELLRGILKFVLESYFKCDAIEVHDKHQALILLGKKDEQFDFIVYDYDPFSYFLEDIQKVELSRLKTKILVLTQTDYAQNIAHFETSTGIKVLQKEKIPVDIIQHISTNLPSVDYLNESAFCRISVNLLIRFEGIRKNLYIKIGEHRMVQILSEDDQTDLSDILKYHRKGQDYLYLRRSTAEIIIKQIQRQIKVFLKANNFKFFFRNPSDSPESEFEQRIIRIKDEIYIDDELQHTIQSTIHKLKTSIYKEKRIDLFMSELMKTPNQFAFFTKKIEVTTHFCIILADKLKWNSKGTTDKIAYAAVLSDITLGVRPKLLQIRDYEAFMAIQENLTTDDRDYFLNHPQECANLATKFFHTGPSDTPTLIMQHHELPNGRGFPNSLTADKIYPLSAAFIIANDIAHYILTNENPSVDEFITENEQRYDYQNFRNVFRALKDVRNEKKSITGLKAR